MNDQAPPHAQNFDQASLRKLASLARLDIDDDACHNLAGDLTRIMSWIKVLGEIDTDGVEAMIGVNQPCLPLRNDVVDPQSCSADRILAGAPDPIMVGGGAEGGFFTVPKMID